MSTAIGIMGEPGSGKTTSLINLDPATTYYIDCDGKGLNWRGWKKQYNAENKNYFKTSHPEQVLALMDNISQKAPQVKTLIIDTLNNLMTSEEMRNCKVRGYDKWTDLAQSVWDIVDRAGKLRDDLVVIEIFHTHTERDESGYIFTKIKTNGKKTEKNSLDSKFNILLLSKYQDERYIFETHANGSTTRTPKDLFDDDTIPNDIRAVIQALEEYENN